MKRSIPVPGAIRSLRRSHATRRAILYSFFAQGLSSPSSALARGLVDGSLASTISNALALAPPVHRDECDAAAARTFYSDRDVEQTHAELLLEYTRLCGNNIVCPHYEADYVGGDSFRAVHVISDVATFYASFGVQVADLAHERPDYIGIELEFMNFLVSKEVVARARRNAEQVRMSRRAQHLFFSKHLGVWAKNFAEAFSHVAGSGFHAALARLMLQFLVAEERFLAMAGIEAAPTPEEARREDTGVRHLKVV